jgi:nucleoside-diphosphate-sugar epimerase
MTEPGGSLHVVFGATGAIGGAVVTGLLHAGRTVRAASRGGQAPDGAQGVAADASDPGQAAHAAAGAAVIYHCASPPYTQWLELFPGADTLHPGCRRIQWRQAGLRRQPVRLRAG